jgi:hypothetical protein
MLLALAFSGGGCGSPPVAPPDGGAPLALDIVAPLPAQIPLHYGMSTALQLRYHTDDTAAQAVRGAPVHFSIFGDPAGSTLSADVATTDVNGLAQVTLTAGQAEAAFRIAATAVNAPEADFDVGVSKLGFVEIDASLAWSNALPAGSLRALLYDTLGCASLPPSPTVPAPFVRAQAKSDAQTASFQFLALLSRDYAVVGRAEDANGKLIGYGCVDLPAALAPPGSISMVPVPLAPTLASPLGGYALTTMLQPATALTQPVLTPWQQFGDCAYGAAQMLLDAIDATEKQAAPSIATAIEAHRDAPLATGCRPVSTTSLDEQLQGLLMAPPMAPTNALPYIADDLEQIVANLTVKSQLTIAAASPSTFSAEHVLQTATIMDGPKAKTYELAPFGLPIIDVKNIPVTYDGATLGIGKHGFTIGFAPLWGQALSDMSITSRLPSLGTPAVHALVAACVAVATRPGNKTGCAAVEDLLCSAIGSPPGCSLQAACSSGIDTVAAGLNAGFAPLRAIDLAWSGTAMPMDTTGMLLVDTLGSGAWTSTALTAGSFTGLRTP